MHMLMAVLCSAVLVGMGVLVLDMVVLVAGVRMRVRDLAMGVLVAVGLIVGVLRCHDDSLSLWFAVICVKHLALGELVFFSRALVSGSVLRGP